MANDFWTEVEEAYARTVQLPAATRAAFLHETYFARPDIRRELESLLQYQPAADRLNQETVLAAAASMFSEDDHDLIGSVVGGKYFIRERLGAGNMGEVYLADHMTLHVPFALKRPTPALKSDPEFRHRLMDEARRAVVLDHENVARVHDIIESDDNIFVVMEYIEGETLRAHLHRLGRPMTMDEFFPIAVQCASGLAAAHEKHTVHLDVKPENIMLTPAGQVKICDFGLARKLSAGTSGSTAVSQAEWTVAGTPAYMAPEVILNYQFDERVDQFSLGVVFYEMLTGRNPFLAETVVATTARVVKDVPPAISESNPEIDPRLERIVMRLLAKEPKERYGATSELVDELEFVRRGQRGIQHVAAGVTEVAPGYGWKKLVAAILLLGLLVAPAVWIYRQQIEQWLGIPALPERKVVAVLPFRVIGDAPPKPYTDGLTDTLTARLSQVAMSPRLEVVPISAVRANGIKTPEQARKNLAANVVIDASIQLVGEAYRITIVLVDTKGRKQLRGKSLTIPQADSIAIQNQITEAAVALLELELAPNQESALITQATQNPGAYSAYLNGVGYLADKKPEDVENAIRSFRDAIALDWNFSLPYAGLGQAYWARYSIELRDPQPQLVDRAHDSCDKALALDSKLAAGHICLGTIYNGTGEYQRAVDEFGRALEAEPSNDDAYRGLARSHERLNNWEAAEATYLKAIDVRPSYWYSYQWLAQFYMFSRQQYAEAIELYRKAIDRAPENSEPYFGLCAAYILSADFTDAVQPCNRSIELKEGVPAYINLGVAFWSLRNYRLAAQSFERAVQLNPRYYKALGHLARTYTWMPEKRAEAPELYRKTIGLAQEALSINPRDPDINVMVARYYAMLDQRVEAVSHLQIALSLRPKDAEYQVIAAVIYNQFRETNVAFGYLERAVASGYSLGRIEAERELDNLREDPRYRALITNQTAKGDRK